MDTPTQSQPQQQTPNQPSPANNDNIFRFPPVPPPPEIQESMTVTVALTDIKFITKDAFDEHVKELNTWKTTFENRLEKLEKEVTDMKDEVIRLKDSQRKCESYTPPCSEENIHYCEQYVQSKYGILLSSAVQSAIDTIDAIKTDWDANIEMAKRTLDSEDGPMQKKFKMDFEKAFPRKTA